MTNEADLDKKEVKKSSTSADRKKDELMVGGYGGGYRFFKDENLNRDLKRKRRPENGPITEANLDPEKK